MYVFILLLTACLNESIDGAGLRSGAFAEPAAQVTILDSGGDNWTDKDLWVAWSGPATLKSSTGYAPCKDLAAVAKGMAKRDKARAKLLAETAALTCQEKGGGLSGRQWLSHSSGVHWWRAWERG